MEIEVKIPVGVIALPGIKSRHLQLTKKFEMQSCPSEHMHIDGNKVKTVDYRSRREVCEVVCNFQPMTDAYDDMVEAAIRRVEILIDTFGYQLTPIGMEYFCDIYKRHIGTDFKN